MSFTLASSVAPVIELFDAVAGEPGEFAKRPLCKAHISPVISPMRYGEDAFDVALACIEHRMPINAIIAGMSKATAPATIDGMLAASLAETLAALCMVNVDALLGQKWTRYCQHRRPNILARRLTKRSEPRLQFDFPSRWQRAEAPEHSVRRRPKKPV